VHAARVGWRLVRRREEKHVHFKDSVAAEDGAPFDWMTTQEAFRSLDAAIEAAINADLDLDSAVIKKRMEWKPQ